jgi:AraC-like DNA-binding protein/ligand-binding sensor protein
LLSSEQKLPRAKLTKENNMNTNADLIETLAESDTYKEYERAFSEATGLPMALRPVETWQLPMHGKRNEAPFCALVASKSRACAACLQMQEKLCQAAKAGPTTMTCSYGLVEAAVPVRVGNETVGFLQTGQVMRKAPSAAQFNRIAKKIEEQDLKIDTEKAKEAYFQTPVLSPKKFDSLTHLLGIFAELLSIKSNSISVRQNNEEPAAITKAKQYIQANHTEELSLSKVAAAVFMSPYYFCKMFHKTTGIHFTEFVSRTRIEKARNLLLNPRLRISEIAYEVGFQSLTHFNRIFKQIMHQSPTEYRDKLPAA